MIAFLNKLFFRGNNVTTIFDILKLQPFMMTLKNRTSLLNKIMYETDSSDEEKGQDVEKDNIFIHTSSPIVESVITTIDNNEDTNDNINTEETIVQPVEDLILPKQSDTLFWCLYILHHGYNDYEQISRNYGVKEMEEKKKIHDFLVKNKTKMKNTNHRVTNVMIQEILSDLITVQKQTNMNVLIAMLVYYNINLLIIDSSGKLMLEYWLNKDDIPNMNELQREHVNTHILYKDNNGKYSLQVEPISVSKIYELKERMFVCQSYEKPVLSESHYKVSDLKEIVKRLRLTDDVNKYKKNELYEMLQKNTVWK